MQSMIVQMKTAGARGSGRRSPQAGGPELVQAGIADPFLQIILNLLVQPSDPDAQVQSDSGVSGEAGAGPPGADSMQGALSALLGNASPGMAALLNTVCGNQPGPADSSNASGVLGQAVLLNAGALDGTQADTGATENTALLNAEALEALSGLPGWEAPNLPLAAAAETLAPAGAEPLFQPADLPGLRGFPGQSAGDPGENAVASGAPDQAVDVPGLAGEDELQLLLRAAGAEIPAGDALSAGDGLSEAAIKVRQLLSGSLSRRQSGSDGQDVREDVGPGGIWNGPAKTDAAAAPDASPKAADSQDAGVLKQVTDGILQNLSLGKSEFAMKLKPESIGEITVKLVEQAGRTTLTITAARAQTARLINSDLDALRAAVAPLHVEVREAVASANETAGGSMQQFGMTGQQFAGQQFAGRQGYRPMAQTGAGQTGREVREDGYAPLRAAAAGCAPGKRLDAYI